MNKRNLVFAAWVVSLAALATASMYASPLTRYNDLTFSRPVGLPGITLPAGEYRFELMIPGADLVRVSNPETNQVYFMRFTQRVMRPATLPAARVVTFGEARAGQAPPIAIWFPQGGGDGHRFVY